MPLPSLSSASSFGEAKFGIGLRQPHYQAVVEQKPALDFLEVHSENFFTAGGVALSILEKIRRDYPISLHGVGLSLGSADQISAHHLNKLCDLIQRIDPLFVSEHLCFGSIDQVHTNDLLPLPKNHSALALLCQRIDQIQEACQRQILVENVSAYLRYKDESIGQAEFLNALAAQTGCGLLLDINNLYVNALNFGEDAGAVIAQINPKYVCEIHLAGHLVTPEVVIDHHGARIADEVWALYQFSQKKLGAHPTLIEWDTDIPDLSVLLEEVAFARQCAQQCEVHCA